MDTIQNGNPDPLAYLRARKSELAERYGIKSIKIFGSRARGDATQESDLDILVQANKPYCFDLLDFVALELQIEEDLGIEVDLVLEEDLKPLIRPTVLAEAISL